MPPQGQRLAGPPCLRHPPFGAGGGVGIPLPRAGTLPPRAGPGLIAAFAERTGAGGGVEVLLRLGGGRISVPINIVTTC